MSEKNFNPPPSPTKRLDTHQPAHLGRPVCGTMRGLGHASCMHGTWEQVWGRGSFLFFWRGFDDDGGWVRPRR
ncbi:unnamed protein product [Periconia digitata]|uniref:Uncharacterized protein n=1 Tax=Periconia digitata TaxID=1303443 RepID=A0A9W4UQE2_9PLEO|nr:unnamed protein product [Periconia digitata]